MGLGQGSRALGAGGLGNARQLKSWTDRGRPRLYRKAHSRPGVHYNEHTGMSIDAERKGADASSDVLRQRASCRPAATRARRSNTPAGVAQMSVFCRFR